MPGRAGRSALDRRWSAGFAPFEGALPDGGVIRVGELDISRSKGLGVWFVNSGREHLVAIREFKHREEPCLGSWWCLVLSVLLQFLCSCVSC